MIATIGRGATTRLLHIIYDDPANPWLGGGAAVRAYEIGRRLASRHQVTLLSGLYPGAERESTTVDQLRIHRVGSARSYPASRIAFACQASAYLRHAAYDLWIYAFSAFAPLWVRPNSRRRSILEFHHLMQKQAAAKIPFFGQFATMAERRVLATYKDIITVSPSLRDLVSSIRGPSGTHLVYNGVDPECFVDDPIEEDYILSFGRLDTYTKGLDLLVQAFRQVAAVRTDIRLVIAGRGGAPEVRKLTRFVEASSLQGRVDIRCNVSRENKKELFRRALFNVASSRYEGWCIAAIEASAAPKAIIGTRIPGLVDAVRDGETGLLVKPESADSLADAILRLCEDKDLRSTLGRSGRAWAEQFSWDRVARDQEAVYQKVMASRERF